MDARINLRDSITRLEILTVALVLAALPLVLTFPLILRMGDGIFSSPASDLEQSGIIPGDHLTNYYRFWLFDDMFKNGDFSLGDQYAFALVGGSRDPAFGWIYGPFFSVLSRAFGGTVAYNSLVLVSLLLLGIFSYLWLRAIGLGRLPSLAGACAFLVFPPAYLRLTAHIKAFFFWLMPASLWLIEIARDRTGWKKWSFSFGAGLTCVVLLTVVEPETALYFWPVLILYSLDLRRRHLLLGLLPGILISFFYLLWFFSFVIGPSLTSAGRTMESLLFYSPGLEDVLRREPSNLERYIYPGVALLSACLGLREIFRDKRPGVKLVFAAIPLVLLGSMGPRAPLIGKGFTTLFENVPAFRVTQTPGRMIFVLGPLLALGTGFAFFQIKNNRRLTALLLVSFIAILIADSRAVSFSLSGTVSPRLFDSAGHVKGVVDLPITIGIDYKGSVYNYGVTVLPAPRVGGVSPFVTKQNIAGWNQIGDMGIGHLTPEILEKACNLRVSHVIVWEDIYGMHDVPLSANPALMAMNSHPRFTRLASDKGIHFFSIRC